ncbi:MAG: thermonuclease family protein [Deltaproteobacteria bacterium]|nr:thermonuclease family protein [Deltaproteobacteria bacterium]
MALILALAACTGSLVDIFGGGDGPGDTGVGATPGDTGEPDDTDTGDEIEADDARVRALTQVWEGDYPARAPMLVRVTYVDDGDTVYVHPDDGSEGFKVRFIGIDTPEVDHGEGDGECYGDEASDFTLDRLKDRLAWLGFDIEYKDDYDRVLAYVTRDEGVDGFHNRVLARQGYASQLTVEPNDSYDEEIEDDVRAAQDEGLGMWESCR